MTLLNLENTLKREVMRNYRKFDSQSEPVTTIQKSFGYSVFYQRTSFVTIKPCNRYTLLSCNWQRDLSLYFSGIKFCKRYSGHFETIKDTVKCTIFLSCPMSLHFYVKSFVYEWLVDIAFRSGTRPKVSCVSLLILLQNTESVRLISHCSRRWPFRRTRSKTGFLMYLVMFLYPKNGLKLLQLNPGCAFPLSHLFPCPPFVQVLHWGSGTPTAIRNTPPPHRPPRLRRPRPTPVHTFQMTEVFI